MLQQHLQKPKLHRPSKNQPAIAYLLIISDRILNNQPIIDHYLYTSLR
ncbi:MAG: hypothetical protein NW214_02550 [Pseudanabaenaceae cyanobacterium bins.39]|nr:hypothetical protein [Pseudanabaenaceae cyanobacterium bins.39]